MEPLDYRKLDVTRLIRVLDQMEECNTNLEMTCKLYPEKEGFDKIQYGKAFRYSFIGFKEIIGSYMSHTLKTVAFASNEKNYMSCIERCIDAELLPDLITFYRKLNRLRNQATHSYEQPDVEFLMRFYSDNRELYVETIKYIREKIIEIHGMS